MARFSFDGNPVMTDTEFENMLSSDKGLRAARYPTGYSDKCGHLKGYHVEWPDYNSSHDLTDEQRETARLRYEQRKEEVKRQVAVPGTLVVITMGCDYPANADGGIGNHRVRIRFTDKNDDIRGAEFCPFWDSQSAPDESRGFTFDRWNSSEQERKEKAYMERMDELEAKYGKGKFIPFEERPEFPATYADRGTVENLPFTWKGLIRWVQRHHRVKFDRVYIDRYFFGCDEIVSEPLNKGNAQKN